MNTQHPPREPMIIIDDLMADQATEEKTDKLVAIDTLMREIDDRITRFCAMTGAKGKPVKKRWQDLKKSSPVPLPAQKEVSIEDVERACRDHLVAQGYTQGDGTWEFQTTIISRFGTKYMHIQLATDGKEEIEMLYQGEAATITTLFTDAMSVFKGGAS